MFSADKINRPDVEIPDVGTLLPDHLINTFEGASAFRFVLPWPISANVYYSKNKRYRSANGRVWAEDMGAAIWRQCGSARPEPLIGRVAIYSEIWLPDDNRRRDLDNFTGKHIQDMYQFVGVIGNDTDIKEDHRYWRSKYKNGALVVHILEI